jgi:hypothetical protein
MPDPEHTFTDEDKSVRVMSRQKENTCDREYFHEFRSLSIQSVLVAEGYRMALFALTRR